MVQEYTQYQVEAGFSQVFSWEEVRRLRPKKLRVSPMEVVPQKNRRGCIILDLSLLVYPGRTKKGSDPIQVSVNDTMERLVPDARVKEIVNVLCRILHFIDSVGT